MFMKPRRIIATPVRNADASEFEVDNWAISEFVLKFLVPVIGDRPFPLTELFLMTAAVCRFNPSHIFEWGTHVGRSARIFYEITNHYRISSEIHSIDLPDNIDHVEHPHDKRGLYVRGLPVHLHQGDGLRLSLEMCRDRKPSRPFFFIDGDHSYKSVKTELDGIIGEVIEPVILVHDTFYQSKESGYNVGPYRAINEINHSRHGFRVLETATGLPGMTLLFRKESLKNR